MSQRDKPRLALKNNTAGVREREEANRTREAGNRDEVAAVTQNFISTTPRLNISTGACALGRWLQQLVRSHLDSSTGGSHAGKES
jgi:hypothetical protein